MEDVLKETKGFIVFQESFMILAQKMAGFTPGESDKMRKILVKKSHDSEAGKDVEREKLRKKFVEGAKKLHNIDEKLSSEIFSKIEYFAGYGFNKSCHFEELVDIYHSDGTFIKSKKIHEILPGDLVKSRDEKTGKTILVRVVDKHDHGILELVEVELNTGEKIRCTWDHKFRTKETGEMLPLWLIKKLELSIVVNSAIKNSSL